MRIGKIKQILDRVVNDSKQLELKADGVFGNQAYIVHNFYEIKRVIEILKDQEWHKVDSSEIENILEKYSYTGESNGLQIEQADFNSISSYISSINSNFPTYYSTISTLVEVQDPQMINVKLPEKEKTFEELSAINKRLDKVFKLFNVDGKGYTLKGFDTGSEWYEIFIVGGVMYQLFIVGLDAAKRYFEYREAYFKSKEAELDYKASLKKDEASNDKDLELYKETRVELWLKELVKDAVSQISEKNGETESSFENKILSGVKELVKELGEGTEFHLSLNPPKYVSDESGKLEIDYTMIRNLRLESGANETTKSLTSKTNAESDAKQTDR